MQSWLTLYYDICPLARAAGLAALTPLGHVFSAYLVEGHSPNTGRPWRRSTRTQIEDNLGRTLRGHEHLAFDAEVLIPAVRAAGWPLLEWTEEHDVWDVASQPCTRETRPRTLAVLTWHSLRHRFARLSIDTYRADPGFLMALGGWENEATVLNRYYRTGAEHTRRGLAPFAVPGR